MDGIAGIYRFVVDGDDAERLYDIFRQSYFIETGCTMQPFNGYSVQVDFSYADGVFRVEEKTAAQISYIADIIYFFVDRDHIYEMSEHIKDGVVQSYTVDDCQGKYFVRPPMTEWELEQEEMMKQRAAKGVDDLPF